MKFKTLAIVLSLLSSSVFAKDIVIKNNDLLFYQNDDLIRCDIAVGRNSSSTHKNEEVTLMLNYGKAAPIIRDITVYAPVKICTVNRLLHNKYVVYLSVNVSETETTFSTTKKFSD